MGVWRKAIRESEYFSEITALNEAGFDQQTLIRLFEQFQAYGQPEQNFQSFLIDNASNNFSDIDTTGLYQIESIASEVMRQCSASENQ